MSRISTMASLLLSLPLLAGPVAVTTVAHAQQVSITARVPFEFTANNERLAAGIFQIKLVSDRFFCCSITEDTTTYSRYGFQAEPDTASCCQVERNDR